jgi:hypothetical protein
MWFVALVMFDNVNLLSMRQQLLDDSILVGSLNGGACCQKFDSIFSEKKTN